jgi:cholesterol oxidase
MPVAITFDPNFTYDQPDPLNNKNSVKHLNDQGVEQGTCVHCGNCDFGCQVHAKNTLDLNYIPQAEKYKLKSVLFIMCVSSSRSMAGIA